MIDYTRMERRRDYLDVSDIPRRRMARNYPAPDGSRRDFDLYYPAQGRGPFPVMVNIAGGGWYFGHPTSVHLGRQIHTATARGYAVVSMACTSSREQKFPYQLHEINGFLRYLKAHAGEYDLDMDFVALQGASSGGHLALLTALTWGDPFYDPPGEGGPTPRIGAVVAIYPCCRLDATVEDYRAIGLEPENFRSGPQCAESVFLGVDNVHDHPDLIRLSSPIHQLRPDAPPVMLLHGTLDRVIPYTLTQEFAQRYRQVAGADKVLVRIIPGVGHSHPSFKSPETCHSTMDFLDRVRRGETPCPPQWREIWE